MKTAFAIVMCLASTCAYAAAPALTGPWQVHTSVAGSDSDAVCTFVQTENKLTGTCVNGERKRQISGTVDGKKATWSVDSEHEGTPIHVTYTTQLDDSGKLAGTVTVDPFGVDGVFTAVAAAK